MKVPTDTEVRFLSFTDEENGKNGSRTYTASLTEEERTRIVGRSSSICWADSVPQGLWCVL